MRKQRESMKAHEYAFDIGLATPKPSGGWWYPHATMHIEEEVLTGIYLLIISFSTF